MNKSLIFYKGTGYGPINKLLRNNNIPINGKLDKLVNDSKQSSEHKILKHIQDIDSVLKINNKWDGRILYRGIKGLKIDVGGLIINKGYTSSSLQEKATYPYLDQSKCCIVYFHLPPGFKLYKYKDKKIIEDEVLIERNTQIKIIAKKNKNYYGVLKKYSIPKIIPKIKNLMKIVENRGDLDYKINDFINNKQNDLNDVFEEIYSNFEIEYEPFVVSEKKVKEKLKEKLKKMGGGKKIKKKKLKKKK